MKTTRFVVAGILCAFTLLLAQVASAADTFSGNWTLMPSEQPGKVHFGLTYRRKHNQSQHSSDWPAEAFQGLDLAVRGKRDVQFAVTRDAGRFDCEGYLNNGVGAGVFLFTPDANYTKTMSSLGPTIERALAMGRTNSRIPARAAVVHVLRGDRPGAVQYLREAIRLGHNVPRLWRQPALAPLMEEALTS